MFPSLFFVSISCRHSIHSPISENTDSIDTGRAIGLALEAKTFAQSSLHGVCSARLQSARSAYASFN